LFRTCFLNYSTQNTLNIFMFNIDSNLCIKFFILIKDELFLPNKKLKWFSIKNKRKMIFIVPCLYLNLNYNFQRIFLRKLPSLPIFLLHLLLWPKFSCGILSNFLRKFPQVSFLRFQKSSGNNYPRRYYLGTLILGKFRRK